MAQAGAGFLLSGSIVELSLLALAAVLLMAGGAYLFFTSRITPAQRERNRRLAVNRHGRMGDATVIDVRDCTLFYSYEVRGVEYTTSQDATELQNWLPAETSNLIGPVGIKYSARNPADSIVICEEWSGLRAAAPRLQGTQGTESSS
jgi:hypothetical protein